MLSTLGQRLDSVYSRRHALEDALCVWPPPLLRDADPATLGVYPARNEAGALEPYRRRYGSEDAGLREAMLSGRNVIVHGPARSGKSRAACEAARRELAGVPVIVPAQGAGLAALIDAGIPRDAFGGRVCLWLDDLQRFIDDLDSRRLSKLADIGENVQIVATIRTGQWRDLVDGSGENAQAFALTQQPSLRLLTGYATSVPSSQRPVELELHASQIRIGGNLTLTPCRPTYVACPAPKSEQDVTVPPDRDRDSALLAAWEMVGNRWEGQIRVSSPNPTP